jgi:hypothetical protein
MSRKVEKEGAYVNLLLHSIPSLCKVVPKKAEAPDFLFNLNGKTIGIEVTELNVPSRRLPHRQIESMEDFITSHARDLVVQRSLPFLSVWLFFNIQESIKTDRLRAIAQAVADTVEWSIPKVGERIELEYPSACNVHPREVDQIHIVRHEHAQRQWWRTVRSSRVMRKVAPLFQEAIAQKDKKYSSYRKQCNECWLLLGAEGTSQSSAIRPEKDVFSQKFLSRFERAFFLRLADSQCHELNLKGC